MEGSRRGRGTGGGGGKRQPRRGGQKKSKARAGARLEDTLPLSLRRLNSSRYTDDFGKDHIALRLEIDELPLLTDDQVDGLSRVRWMRQCQSIEVEFRLRFSDVAPRDRREDGAAAHRAGRLLARMHQLRILAISPLTDPVPIEPVLEGMLGEASSRTRLNSLALQFGAVHHATWRSFAEMFAGSISALSLSLSLGNMTIELAKSTAWSLVNAFPLLERVSVSCDQASVRCAKIVLEALPNASQSFIVLRVNVEPKWRDVDGVWLDLFGSISNVAARSKSLVTVGQSRSQSRIHSRVCTGLCCVPTVSLHFRVPTTRPVATFHQRHPMHTRHSMRILTKNSQNSPTAPTSPYTLEVPRTTNS
jgi:hypothetical protein